MKQIGYSIVGILLGAIFLCFNSTAFPQDLSNKAQDGYSLANDSFRQAKYDEAEILFSRLLAEEEKQDENSLAVAKITNKLGGLYRILQRYEDSEYCYQRTLRIFEREFGPIDPKTAIVLNNLGKLYLDAGELEKANHFLENALKTMEESLGPDSPLLITILSNYSDYYRKNSWYDRAAANLQRAIEIAQKTKEPQSAELLPLLIAQSSLYKGLSDREKCTALLEQALIIAEKEQQTNPSAIADLKNELALQYWNSDRREEAIAFFEQAWNLSEQNLPVNHPVRAICLYNLALSYRETGQYEKAEPLFNHAIETAGIQIYHTTLHARLCVARAVLYSQTNRIPRAYEDLRKALEWAFEPQLAWTAGLAGKMPFKLIKDENNLFTFALELQEKSLHNMAEAYAVMEQSRAFDLFDLSQSNQISLNLIDPLTLEELRREEKSAQVEVICLEARIMAIEENPERSRKDQAEWERLVNRDLPRACKRTIDASEAMRKAAPVYGQVIEPNRKLIPFTQLQSRLKSEKTLALEYLIDENRGFLLAYGSGLETPVLLPLKVSQNQAKLLGLTLQSTLQSTSDANRDSCWFSNKQIRQVLKDAEGKYIENLPENDDQMAKCSPLLNSPEKINVLWQIIVPDETLAQTVLAQKKILVLRNGFLGDLSFDNFIVQYDKPNKTSKRLKDFGGSIIYAHSIRDF